MVAIKAAFIFRLEISDKNYVANLFFRENVTLLETNNYEKLVKSFETALQAFCTIGTCGATLESSWTLIYNNNLIQILNFAYQKGKSSYRRCEDSFHLYYCW